MGEMLMGGFWDEAWGTPPDNGIVWAEQQTECIFDVVRMYFALGQPLSAEREGRTAESYLREGKRIVLSVHPGGDNEQQNVNNERAVAQGERDATLHKTAQELYDLCKITSRDLDVLFSWHHEPVISKDNPVGQQGRQTFQDAWDRWDQILADESVPVMRLPIFTQSGINNGVDDLKKEYFEGIGSDGYNWFGSTWHSGSQDWRWPENLFQKLVQTADRWGVTPYVCETGCAEGPNAEKNKPDWIRRLKALAAEHDFGSLMYFQSPPNKGDGRIFNIASTPESLAAFTEAWCSD
jgi:hypothetical protein